ncbi:MAG: hypothetical protein RLZZ500_945 [Bacteroidota bacterium]|jgi:glyoxylase I family protein
MLQAVHHIAIIVSDYEKSKVFYTEVLGFEILQEVYREERQSYKLDLALQGEYCIELFSFPDYQPRASRPEALGLRHLAFAVDDIEAAVSKLKSHQVEVEPLRIDEYTSKQFTFFFDPDGLPLELYSLK